MQTSRASVKMYALIKSKDVYAVPIRCYKLNADLKWLQADEENPNLEIKGHEIQHSLSTIIDLQKGPPIQLHQFSFG